MPGLSLSSAAPGDHPDPATLDGLLYLDDYERRDLHAGATTRLAATGYDAYPVATHEDGDLLVALEGRLYATDDPGAAALAAGRHALAGDTAWLREWLLERDAEFLLVAVDRSSGDVAVCNDVLGRLPTYRYATDDRTLVSRELGFVLDAVDASMDGLGVAETLLFGYPLGERTLYEGVEQLPGGSLLRLSAGEVTETRLHELRFDRKPLADRSVAENADRLADLLRAACERRATGRSVVSLSGGLDSRAVAAVFAASGLPFEAVTFDRGGDDGEVAAAREVATRLDAPWTRYELGPPTGADLRRLLATKRGLNFLGMGFIVGFLERLRDDYGPGATYVTGDGGDKVLPAHLPRSFDDREDLLGYLLADASRFDLDTVAGLAAPTAEEVVADVRRVLADYPTTDPDELYELFLFRERGAKWLYHGEDRNRYFLWHDAPFWSWPVVSYAMRVPDAQKRRERLFRQVIESLAPPLVDVEYANFGAPIDSVEYRLKRFTYDTLGRYPQVRNSLVSALRGGTDGCHPAVARVLTEQADAGVDGALSSDGVAKVAADRGRCDPTRAAYLLTVTSAAEALAGESTLAAYDDTRFA